MTAPTPEALTETIRHAAGIVEQLCGDWALILYDATHPRGVDRDRATRVHPRPPKDDPDYVRADRDDPGVGDHHARKACRESARLVAQANRLAGQAVTLLLDGQMRTVRNTPPTTPAQYRTLTHQTAHRLQWLHDRGAASGSDQARTTTHAAASALLEAQAALRGVLRDYDAVGEPTADRRCWNCQRPTGTIRNECEACRKYRARAETAIRAGKTVPHRLRPVPRYDDAHRARQRRQERLLPGQLDIEAPVPSGNWVEGEWTQATPHPAPDPRKRAS